MRVGCLQFAPQVGDIDNNISRADAVLSRANPQDLDLLVLPELAFAGYNFKSLQEISPFLEPRGSGISALWARTAALKLDCVVTVGYPEKEDVKHKWPTSPEYYNSVLVVNPDGETIAHYRKSFLYYTDETWALEGPEGFYGGSIPQFGTTAMGICMDINPYKFEAPWHAFEFAFHCLEVEANLVIVTMAWMTREDASLFSSIPNEPDMDTLTYWMARLEPLIRSDNQEEIIVIFCNRAGIERDTVYAGTSTVIGIKDGEVNVYGLLGRGEERLLVVDTEKPPIAKLVYSPNDQGSTTVPTVESPSATEEAGKRINDQTATKKSSSKNGSTRSTEGDVAQDQALLEEARFISNPHSIVSQESHSNYQAYSNKRSSFRLSSKNLESCPIAQLSNADQLNTNTPPGPDATKVSPSVLISTQSDRSLIPRQGIISSKSALSQCYSYSGTPSIHISSPPTEGNAGSPSTRPILTSLAGFPKLVIQTKANKQPHTRSLATRGRSVWNQKQTEVVTIPTTFDNVVPWASNELFCASSDALLRIPMEARPWTPARADSPTLSQMPIISQS
ncbi:carbon-nitrogen hydrolase [Xylaria sp. FL0064]|nr:carbon-nitrogen hydrolase [Xylaria sp. FL0064]